MSMSMLTNTGMGTRGAAWSGPNSASGVAAIHGQLCAGYERGVVGGQEEDGVGDVFVCGKATQRRVGDAPSVFVLAPLGSDHGWRKARVDGVGTNASRGRA